jgi:hypothetical protein
LHFIFALEKDLVRFRVLLRVIIKPEKLLPHILDRNSLVVSFIFHFSDQFEDVLFDREWECESIRCLAWLKQLLHLLLLINLHFLETLGGRASHRSRS